MNSLTLQRKIRHEITSKISDLAYLTVAIIYGMADSERRFINKLPGEVKKIEDIPKVKMHFERKVKEKDTGFFALLLQGRIRQKPTKFRCTKRANLCPTKTWKEKRSYDIL